MKTRSVTHRTPYAHSYTEKRSAPFLLSLLFFFLPQTVLHFTTTFLHLLTILPKLCSPNTQSVHLTLMLSSPDFGCVLIPHTGLFFVIHLWQTVFEKFVFFKNKSLIIFPQFLIMSSGLFGCYLEAVRVGNEMMEMTDEKDTVEKEDLKWAPESKNKQKKT